MSRTTYAAHRTAGLCGLCGMPITCEGVICIVCRNRGRHSQRVIRGWTPRPDTLHEWDDAGQERWLACCGTWHRITAVPFTTPCCGRVLAYT